ncbi:MAG: response regulator [Emticicia sp.]|uniref:response regulator n=1 Tax=Emticicia sp. TaxID=1930953 RepID=UPI003BA7BBC2
MKEKLRCLILDDSLIDQLSLEIILSEYGEIKTTSVSTPEQFSQTICQNNYQLFMIDINLGTQISGIELAKQIPHKSQAWVIFCSAADCQKYYDLYKELSLRKFYLQKPIDEFSLRTYVDSFLRHF